MPLLFSMVLVPTVHGQHEQHWEDCNLQSLFKRGHIGGHVRSFSMSTLNPDRPDYWTSAMGAGLHFETGIIKGFSAGLEGVFAFRLASNELTERDSLSGRDSRFEQQLYDLEHPDNYDDLDRLEELYLRYQTDGFITSAGRIRVETPIVNAHDGRMKPKVYQGVQADWSPGDHHFYGGWITHASPRSTTHWYRLQDAMGIYNNGCLPNGAPADYRGSVRTRGLALFGWEAGRGGWQMSAWNYWLENVSNTTLLQFETDSIWIAGFQMLHQRSAGDGGLPENDTGFIRPDQSSQAFSARIGRRLGEVTVTLNASYITDKGAYLFPREFGQDPFYTTLTRGWLEGLGSATAVMSQVKWEEADWSIAYGGQVIWLRGNPEDFSRNKYGMYSHFHQNLDLRHDFTGFLQGVKARMLYTFVTPLNREEVPAERLHNLLDFHHFSLVFEMGF